MPKRVVPQPAILSTEANFDEDEQRRAGNNLRRKAPSRSTSLSSIAPRPAGKIRLAADGDDMQKALVKAFKVSVIEL